MRLDKFLANAGIGSRKDVKKIIKSKEITVNGVIVTDQQFIVSENDDIAYQLKPILYKPYLYYMMNKPSGVISATEDPYHKTVIDLIDENHHLDLFPVGRLDIDTVGLLIITNDGALSHELLSPKKHVDKTYYVEFSGEYHDDIPSKFAKGIDIGDYVTKPAQYEFITEKSCKITICEGKFHQVKRMMKAVGLDVTYLKRTSFGNLTLDELLEEGKYRELTQEELIKLQNKH